MNWRFSYQLGTSPADSYTWAIFSVALDVVKWFMLPIAVLAWTDHKLRAAAAFVIWMVATIFSFTAALGFAATNRDTTTAVRQQQKDLHATLATMKQSPRWQSSSACADANTTSDKQFCANYRAAAAGIQSPAEDVDAQSTLLSRLTGLKPETVRLVLVDISRDGVRSDFCAWFFCTVAANTTGNQHAAESVAAADTTTTSPRHVQHHHAGPRHSATHRDQPRHGKAPGSYSGGAPFQEVSLCRCQSLREAIQASTSEQYQATLQGPSFTRWGNSPAFSSRAMCCEQ